MPEQLEFCLFRRKLRHARGLIACRLLRWPVPILKFATGKDQIKNFASLPYHVSASLLNG